MEDGDADADFTNVKSTSEIKLEKELERLQKTVNELQAQIGVEQMADSDVEIIQHILRPCLENEEAEIEYLSQNLGMPLPILQVKTESNADESAVNTDQNLTSSIPSGSSDIVTKSMTAQVPKLDQLSGDTLFEQKVIFYSLIKRITLILNIYILNIFSFQSTGRFYPSINITIKEPIVKALIALNTDAATSTALFDPKFVKILLLQLVSKEKAANYDIPRKVSVFIGGMVYISLFIIIN